MIGKNGTEDEMQVPVVAERFPVSVVENGGIATQFLPVRSLFDGAENQLFVFNPAVERAVISCHGSGSDAYAYASIGHDASALAGASAETLVVAPQFAIPSDLIAPDVLAAEPKLLYWNDGRWSGQASGSTDAYPRVVRLSAFTTLDALIRHIAESGLFPNLHTIVLVGQSGGGQLILRYAFASRYDPPEHIQLRYIPMNPGSVVYTSSKRAVMGGKFEVPDDARLSEAIAASNKPSETVDELRKKYDRWGLGMDRLDRNPYLEKDSRVDMVARFRHRAVAYLIGEHDNDPNSRNLPRSPGDMLQGPHRLERSRLMELHFKDEGAWNASFHVRRIVPGVDHSGKRTMTSPLGLWYIFGYEVQTYPSLEFFPGEAALSEILEILRRMGGRVPVDPRPTAPSPVPGSSADPTTSLSGSLAPSSLAREPLGRASSLEVLTRGTAFARRERS